MEFRLLGLFEVRERGRTVALPRGKERTLLAVLLLHANEPVSTDRLVEELWGQQQPENAAKAVQVYVSRLRKSVGPERLQTTPAGYLLRVEHGELDSEQFEQLARDGRDALGSGDSGAALRLHTQALALWRGPALADFQFEPFAQAEVRRLEELRTATAADLIDARLAHGEVDAVISELETLLAENPLWERPRAQLILALYRAGRQGDALELYRKTRALLADELGIEPGPELQALERAILNHDKALATPASATRQVIARRRRGGVLLVVGGVVLLLAAIAATIALTRDGAIAQVVAALPNSVAVIDPRTDGVVADIPVGNTPTTVVARAGSIWVLNSNEQTVSLIDVRSRAAARRIPATMSASDIAAGAGALWVAGRTQTLANIDPTAPLNASTLALSDPQSATPAAGVGRVAAAGRAVWATSPNGIWRIEPAPKRQFAIAGGSCCGPVAIGLGSIWVAHEFSLERLNASSGASQAHITLPFAGSSMAIGKDGVWVGDQLTDRVWFFDPKRNVLDASIQVGQHPSAIAIGAGAVWVASGDGTVTRIDLSTHRVTKTIAIGGTPSGIAVGGGLIWVAVD